MQAARWAGLLTWLLVAPAAHGQSFESIRGRVVDTAGKPLAGATVVLPVTSYLDYPWTDLELVTTTDRDGRYTFASLPKASSHDPPVVHVPGYRYVSGGRWAGLTVRDAQGERVLMRHPKYHATVLARVDQLCAGVVLDLDGRPVAGARVLALDCTADQPARTGTDGRFILRRLPAGPLTLVAIRGETERGQVAARGGDRDVVLRLGIPTVAEREAARAAAIETIQREGVGLWRDFDALCSASRLELEPFARRVAKVEDEAERYDLILRYVRLIADVAPDRVEPALALLDDCPDETIVAAAQASVAVRLAATQPDRATDLLDAAAGVGVAVERPAKHLTLLAAMVAAAHRLRWPQYEEWLDAFVQAAKDEWDEEGDLVQAALSACLADDARAVEQLAPDADPWLDALDPDPENTLMAAWFEPDRALAVPKPDLDRLFDGPFYRMGPPLVLVRRLTWANPDTGLRFARRLEQVGQYEAMLVAALSLPQPADQRAALARCERLAATWPRAERSMLMRALAHIDLAAARALRDAILAEPEPLEPDDELDDHVEAEWAYHLAAVDPNLAMERIELGLASAENYRDQGAWQWRARAIYAQIEPGRALDLARRASAARGPSPESQIEDILAVLEADPVRRLDWPFGWRTSMLANAPPF